MGVSTGGRADLGRGYGLRVVHVDAPLNDLSDARIGALLNDPSDVQIGAPLNDLSDARIDAPLNDLSDVRIGALLALRGGHADAHQMLRDDHAYALRAPRVVHRGGETRSDH